MGKETEDPLPDDPSEALRSQVIACAEKQKGYDICERIKQAPIHLLQRMRNRPLYMMRALLEEFAL